MQINDELQFLLVLRLACILTTSFMERSLQMSSKTLILNRQLLACLLVNLIQHLALDAD